MAASPEQPAPPMQLMLRGQPVHIESARHAAKPAIEILQIGLSVPPATITSASSSAMMRAASPIACVPVAQAVTTALFGPRRLCMIET